jgi:transposase-like protein
MFDSENLSSSVRPDMKMKRKTYEGLFKARVVSEWIDGKINLNELAERYSVHPNQIKNWKSLLLKGASQVLDDKRRLKSH